MTQSPALLDPIAYWGVIRGRWKSGFCFHQPDVHLHFPAQLFFDRSPAGRIRLLDSTLDVIRIVAAGLVELNFDLARDFEQAMID